MWGLGAEVGSFARAAVLLGTDSAPAPVPHLSIARLGGLLTCLTPVPLWSFPSHHLRALAGRVLIYIQGNVWPTIADPGSLHL